jgi:hypothetical protein
VLVCSTPLLLSVTGNLTTYGSHIHTMAQVRKPRLIPGGLELKK